MFRFTFVCSFCHSVFYRFHKGGAYESASMCDCGKAAPLIGVEECITTSSNKRYNEETS